MKCERFARKRGATGYIYTYIYIYYMTDARRSNVRGTVHAHVGSIGALFNIIWQ